MMKKIKWLALGVALWVSGPIMAQSLTTAKTYYNQGEYEKAKPIFYKYLRNSPSNGAYNLWYGVCCLETGEAERSIKYLKMAVKRKTRSGRLHLGRAYCTLYQFEDAVACYEAYVEDLTQKKRNTEEAEQLLERAEIGLRMLKGVEEVSIIDSIVVDKNEFLSYYKMSEESGKLHWCKDLLKAEGKQDSTATAYETQMGDKIFYSKTDANEGLNIYQRTRLMTEWNKGKKLPKSVNGTDNSNYPFVMSDGVTIFFASDGEESLGGYDIFATRYNTTTGNYLNPENIGMPFNSPANDYMYVIDEYNNLGWFASDRMQPEGKVCIYIFIPNESKRVFNYEGMDKEQLIKLAQITSIFDTWKDSAMVKDAQKRLKEAKEAKPKKKKKYDFEFIVNDGIIYHSLTDFKAAEAKELFLKYQQKQKELLFQQEKLQEQRTQYAEGNKGIKNKMRYAIVDLEKRLEEMEIELERLEMKVRNAEIKIL